MLPVQILLFQEIEEEERRQNIRENNIQRRIMRNNSDPFSVSDTRFLELYRLTKDMVIYLIEQLVPHMTLSTHPNSVSPVLRIFTALYFFATGSYQRSLGQSFVLSMAQNTVSKCVNEVSQPIVSHMSEAWIKFPLTANEKIMIKQTFMQHFQFPGTIGAIDCTHVTILAPSFEEHNYLNRKGFHSKNVQIICDANLKILNINARYAGATHDAFIWRNSVIQEKLFRCYEEGDHNSWLIGDSGYPQQPWLMTSILNANLGTPEDRYNQRHAFARNCIERCNGVLKTRFRCILDERTLRYNSEKVGNIVNACAILHNICTDGRLDAANVIQIPNIDNNDVAVEDGQINNVQDARRELIERYFQN